MESTCKQTVSKSHAKDTFYPISTIVTNKMA